MRHSLFFRMFSAFLAALMVTVLVLSITLVALLRAERQDALQAEVQVQARDLAALLQVQETISFWLYDPAYATSAAVNGKIDELQKTYDAEIWLVNAGGYAVIMNGGQVKRDDMDDGRVTEQIRRVLTGEEVRLRGILPGYENVVTIGVPWFNVSQTQTLGAVFVNVGLSSLHVDLGGIVRYVALGSSLALVLGSLLAFFIARRQSAPISRIDKAVNAFARGQFDERVSLEGLGELEQLGRSFNAMAEELNRLDKSRSSFVANVSHELRSPMTSIHGYVQGMLDGTIQGEERDKYLNVVLSETKRLTKLVNELLDLSRIDSGNIALDMTVFDVTELILSVMFTFEKRIEEKNLDVDISFVTKPCPVKADSARITQVLTNLLDTAVKFAATGGQLTMWTRDEGPLCRVIVKNDGETIPTEDLPFVFDRFYKVD